MRARHDYAFGKPISEVAQLRERLAVERNGREMANEFLSAMRAERDEAVALLRDARQALRTGSGYIRVLDSIDTYLEETK